MRAGPFLVIALVSLLAYALSVSQDDVRGEEINLYGSSVPLDATLLRLDKTALEQAYEDQLRKLFGVWLSQQATDARPITNGLAIARRAYRQASAQIAKREHELQQLLEKDHLIGEQR